MAAVGGLGCPLGRWAPRGSQRCWRCHPAGAASGTCGEKGSFGTRAWLRLRVETAWGLRKGAALGPGPRSITDGTSLPAPQAQHPHSPPLWPASPLGPGNPLISAALRALPPGSAGALCSSGRPPCLGSDPGHLDQSELLLLAGGTFSAPWPCPDLGWQPRYPPPPRAAAASRPGARVDRGRPSGKAGPGAGVQEAAQRPPLPQRAEARRAGGGAGGRPPVPRETQLHVNRSGLPARPDGVGEMEARRTARFRPLPHSPPKPLVLGFCPKADGDTGGPRACQCQAAGRGVQVASRLLTSRQTGPGRPCTALQAAGLRRAHPLLQETRRPRSSQDHRVPPGACSLQAGLGGPGRSCGAVSTRVSPLLSPQKFFLEFKQLKST